MKTMMTRDRAISRLRLAACAGVISLEEMTDALYDLRLPPGCHSLPQDTIETIMRNAIPEETNAPSPYSDTTT